MVKEIKREYSILQGESVSSYICDGDADVSNLPECACGSSALVIATGDVYVVNTQGAWTKVGG